MEVLPKILPPALSPQNRVQPQVEETLSLMIYNPLIDLEKINAEHLSIFNKKPGQVSQ